MDGLHILIDVLTSPLRSLILVILFSVSCADPESLLPRFDGKRAFQDLVMQCEFGPRVPGTEPHERMEEWMIDKLELYADTVLVDSFSYDSDQHEFPVFRNYVARFDGESEQRVLLCAHYDTRPVADEDPEPLSRDKPISGANDGASGVAVLMEMARLFSVKRSAVNVDMVFFDGEDYGENAEHMLLGSRRFASENSDYRPLFGILLDMVGDSDLQIYQEIYSLEGAREIVKRVWDLSSAMGLENIFIPIPRYAVYDDHVPLLQAGIRCIDIIDFDYPYWHTAGDTPDKCSPESLETVGNVLTRLVYEVIP